MSDSEHKTLVQRALAGLVDARDVASVAPFMSEHFVHHRPDGDDSTKAEWLARVEAAFDPTAGMRVKVLHLLAADDHVMVHSRRRLPAGAEVVVVDIVRIEDGLIAEVWEIIEPVANAAADRHWWSIGAPV
ncbi:nuclear transport factor 2 family protein [Dactylosporangium sp. NPDC051541]|uniref:nuclear transport factor 2 family protein n=1 Tax=Dactylosporangium sp. NPDC051541 TaxID=3363977 RepID=UPI003793B0EC